MNLPWRRCAGVAATLIVSASGPCVLAAPVQTSPMVMADVPAAGLIVKLRDAPAHPRAQTLGTSRSADDHVARVHRVLSRAGLGTATLHRTGRAAHLLDFGRPLPAHEARSIADRLRARSEVEWVVPNERERRLQVPDDPMFAASAGSSGQWWLRPVAGSSGNVLADRTRGVPGLQSAWAVTTGNPQAVVAVLDTGITSHPDLDANVLPGHDFVSEVVHANDGDGRDADPTDPGDWVSQDDRNTHPAAFGSCDIEPSSWHGTVISGIVAAVTANGAGVAGVNWNGRVLPVRVAGKCGASVADIVDGMRWAAGLPVAGAPMNAHPARIINISFGGSAPCNAAYQEAIDELRAEGAVVVAAAGNDRGAVKRPASCTGVIGVAALNRDGFKANYSNFGPAVLVSTVGGDPQSEGAWGSLLGDDGLLTVDNRGVQGPEAPSYGRVAGTSFATPVVAGVLSLMLSTHPGLSVAQLIDGVRRSARPHAVSTLMQACSAQNPGRCLCTTSTCGAGMLDAHQALIYASAPESYVAPVSPAAVLDSRELTAAVALGADSSAGTGDGSGGNSSADGGGGALEAGWLLLLAIGAASLGLARFSCRPSGRRARTPCPGQPS